jgi:glycosidase
MRQLCLVLFALFLFPQLIFSQTLGTEPAIPTLESDITIRFDAESTALEGHSGNLYAHTGVIVSEEDRNSGNWSYVVADWGVNEEKLRLTDQGDDIWELEIGDIREYYDIPGSVEEISQLAFVFRSEDAQTQTSDLFLDIYENELAVRFSSPSVSAPDPWFSELNETVDIVVDGASPDGVPSSITLFENGAEIASVQDADRLEFSYSVNQSGRTDFTAVAENNAGDQVEDEFYLIVNPELTRQTRPAGVEDGIHYHDDGSSVTFSFYAPGKEFAYLIGDETEWEVREEFFMKLDESDPDAPRFWLTVEDLTPRESYRFQYFVDGEIRVADLFSELILHPEFDSYISESVYPDIPQYPTGLTDYEVMVVKPGREEYQWQVPDFERPPKEELVIYELLLRDFLEESSYEVLTDTLGYLENLGVNAIELMPVQEFDGNLSWGYNPVFHGALDKSYGTRRAFKEFVDEAHSRGMAVILDVVYNHAHDRSPLIRMFGTNRSDSFETGNPLLGPGHAYNVFFHLNHDHDYIQYWLDRMNRYWAETYNIDGYRFDLTKGFASNVNNQSLLDGRNPDRIDNLKRMADELWDVDESIYVILEHFAANSEEQELAEYGMMLWGNHNHTYSEAAMGHPESSDFSGIHFENRGWDLPHLIGYMESHDEQWMMFRNLNYGNDLNEDHDVTELNTALNRQKLAGAFFLTIPGPKMLWQFGELGYGGGENECLKPGDGSDGDCLPSDPGRTAEKPVRWDYYDDEARHRLYRSWSELLRLRHSSPVFSSGETDFESSLNGDVKWIRMQHDDMDAVLVGNFGVINRSRSVEFPASGEWHEFVRGTTRTLENNRSVSFDLAPGEFYIYTSEAVEPAEENVFYRVGDTGFTPPPDEFVLEPNYPNPFQSTTNLVYYVPEEAPVLIEVFDLLGRRIKTLVDEASHPEGQYPAEFDGSSLSSGVYLVRLTSGDTTRVRKITLIK